MSTDTITLDAPLAIAILTWAVEKLGAEAKYVKPEYVKGCVYIEPFTNSCSCIVAHALHHAGMTIEEIAVLDTQSHYTPTSSITIAMAELPKRVHISALARNILRIAQDHQDEGGTFGESLRWAKLVYERGTSDHD